MLPKIELKIFPLICIFLLGCLACSSKEESESVIAAQEQNTAGESTDTLTNTYNVVVEEGIKHIHNTGALWGKDSAVKLERIRIIGEGPDNNLLFHKPADINLDKEGNLYVLDAGNHRIQKLSPEGKFLDSLGRKGQGPGEFQFMGTLVLDDSGNIWVTDLSTNRIKVLDPSGKELRNHGTGKRAGRLALLRSGKIALAKNLRQPGRPSSAALVSLIDGEENVLGEIGREEQYEDWDAFRYFNRIAFTLDKQDHIYLAYATRNKIEKFTPTGELILRIDRPINYPETLTIKQIERQVGPRKIEIPQVNMVSVDIAIDEKERIWVLSYDRQLKFEEMGISIAYADQDGRFEGSQTLKTSEKSEIDAFVFHIFNKEGHFMGKIPLTHYGGIVRIFKDRLYILENRHDMLIYIYKMIG